MSIDEMITQIDLLARKDRGTGATDLDIADAERAIGVRLPASYKTFLSTFGWARIYHDPLYGVGPSVPPEYRLVDTTLCERYQAHPHIPHHLVPIMNNGAGNHYCLDTANYLEDECPVIFWDHEHQDGPNQSPEQVSSSFDRWLIDLIVNSPYADDV